jgi:two-component system, sensor histidine kinase and response regulator
VKVLRAQKSCLIADDDPVYREVAGAALEDAGYAVVLAADGGEALQKLAAETFDVVIADLTMPIAGGLDVIKATRTTRGPNTYTPIVVITGSDDTEAIETAFEIGATSFLTKPLNWPLFRHHIDFVYRSGQSELELREANQASAFLSDLKTQTMKSLAEDFMRPVKTIFGFSELIRREAYGPLEPPTYKEMIADMGAAAQNLNASLLKLMDLGASLADRLDLHEQSIPLADFIDTATAGFHDKAHRRGVTLKFESNIPRSLTVYADPALLSQAVRSILDNAVKLAPRGTTIDVNANFSINGDFHFSATDFGPAISAELIAEVTGPALKTAARDLYANRDVGIKIAKSLVEVHQGQLHVNQTENGGNVVELKLPKVRFVTRDANSPTAASVVPPETALEQRAPAATQPFRAVNTQLAPAVTARLAGEISTALKLRTLR